ncbi:MAG: hypothetical protein K2P64_11555 [Lachnospiraceae bacterium]|nr:hypothetical protein [Lachnospiraceae bacterium]
MTESSVDRYLAYEAEKEKWEKGEAENLYTSFWDVYYIERQKEQADSMTFRSYNFSRGYVRKALSHK